MIPKTCPWPDGKHRLFFDFETYGEQDISKVGSFRYINDPSFEVILLAYAIDDGPVYQLEGLVRDSDFEEGVQFCTMSYNEEPDFLSALRDPEVVKVAHNCAFEREVLRVEGSGYQNPAFGYQNPAEYEDTMVLAAQCGLPLSLDGAGKALGLPEDKAKMKEGKALIRYFCQPCKPTKANGLRTRNFPDDDYPKWLKFCEYNERDVEATRTIYKMLFRWRPLPREHLFWELDCKINERGCRIDWRLASQAVKMNDRHAVELTEKAREISGLSNPKSVSQVKAWLEEMEGIHVETLNKKSIDDVLSKLTRPETRQFMAIRSELSKSSTAKYDAMLRSLCYDGTVKGCFLFYGANRTGRFAGRLVQFQNLPQNHMEDLDECRALVKGGFYDELVALYGGVSGPLSELIRTAIIPDDGGQLLVSDFSAIEARVIAWIAGEEWRLQVFRDGGDIYCASASQMFKVPVVKHGVNGHLRQKGKVAELACIAEGELVLTDQGLVPIEEVTPEQKVWDGEAWVSHAGVVFRGVKEVMRYDGLWATPDHPVWVRGEPEPVHFGVAAKRGAHLVQTGGSPGDLRTGVDYLGPGPVFSGFAPSKPSRVYDILNAGPNHRFTVSGKLVHNCGYGGGPGALKAFGADKMGMTEEEMQETIDLWRARSPKIKALWGVLEKAAIKCAQFRSTVVVEREKCRIPFFYESLPSGEHHIIWVGLPSGRRIAYFDMKYDWSSRDRNKRSLSYMGQDQTTKKWTRVETWGGKLTENLVQATARDCLRESMLALDEEGYDIRAHVHDECIVTEPLDGRSVEEMSAVMSRPISWAPGLPLRADGYACTSYRKD